MESLPAYAYCTASDSDLTAARAKARMTRTPRIPRVYRRDANRTCRGTHAEMEKKCGNEDAFCCNAAVDVRPVTRKESASNDCLSNPVSVTM